MTSILRSIGFKKSKHTKLSEEWTDCQEPVKEGFTFYCRYLGSTPIEQSSNATMTSHAVKHILSMAKAKGKKLPNIALFISPTFISGTVMEDNGAIADCSSSSSTPDAKKDDKKDFKKQQLEGKKSKDKAKKQKKGKESLEMEITDVTTEIDDQTQPSSELPATPTKSEEKTLLFKISIFRIPYCFAEATYDRIVAFVATNPNGSHECHAIIASKRKFAQAIALTISQAFDIAYNRLNKNKSPAAQQQLLSEQKLHVNNMRSTAQRSIIVGSNRLSCPLSDDNEDSDKSDSGNSSCNEVNTNNQIPPLKLENFNTLNSRRRRRLSKEASESSEDEKKENAENNNNNNELKLLINFDDESAKTILDCPSDKVIEKPLFDLDELRDLF